MYQLEVSVRPAGVAMKGKHEVWELETDPQHLGEVINTKANNLLAEATTPTTLRLRGLTFVDEEGSFKRPLPPDVLESYFRLF